MLTTFTLMLVTIITLSIVFSVSILISIDNKEPQPTQEGKVYQGPVPPGYDLDYFRKTGETIKLSENG